MKRLPFRDEQIRAICASYPTPFYLYDERGIREQIRALKAAFAWNARFQEYFAVKATPTPAILRIMREEGCGLDCSSLAELILAEQVGITGDNLFFSSNNTPIEEYQKAFTLGAIINLDDISHIDYIAKQLPALDCVALRYNPGPLRQGNPIIGNPVEAKFGVTREQLFEGYAKLRDLGAKRFALHTMVVSNELKLDALSETADMLFRLAAELQRAVGIQFECINLGGGIGIPYRPEQEPVDLMQLGQNVRAAFEQHLAAESHPALRIALECGRLITGPHGYLITKVRHLKQSYKRYAGLDATMADLMRPGMYGAYHHVSVLGKQDQPHDQIYDLSGSLCENNDKFAIDRALPQLAIGDICVIHDAGAHGRAMGFNYNGKLRCGELLLTSDGSVRQIRRPETLEDYFATVAGL
jgi:Diaminopimelate decarboxylase